eukprot:3874485-Prymnesium_polylepis.1
MAQPRSAVDACRSGTDDAHQVGRGDERRKTNLGQDVGKLLGGRGAVAQDDGQALERARVVGQHPLHAHGAKYADETAPGTDGQGCLTDRGVAEPRVLEGVVAVGHALAPPQARPGRVELECCSEHFGCAPRRVQWRCIDSEWLHMAVEVVRVLPRAGAVADVAKLPVVALAAREEDFVRQP